MVRAIVLCAAAIALLASSAGAQYIGIFREPSATNCAAQVGPTPWVDLHVVMVFGGNVTELVAAQFQITGAPETWTVENALWVPDPGTTLNLGTPLFATPAGYNDPGVYIGFSGCRTGAAGDHVQLGRIILLGAPTPENVHLRVEGSRPWWNLPPVCPLTIACDGLYSTKVCVGGGEFVLNGSVPASCQVAVTPTTWTSVKKLYE